MNTMFKLPFKLLYGVALSVLLASCSSRIPPSISTPVENSPEIRQVIANPAEFSSRKVRWAGVVLSTENTSGKTRLTIVEFPIYDNGRPRLSVDSAGRFIAEVDEFLEPLVYREDREITIVGRIDRIESGKVGEYLYDFPVVKVDEYYLWPKRKEYVDYPDPYYRPYYGPYFYPHYPFRPWPYYPYYPYRYKR